MSELIPITTPLQEFKGHEHSVIAIAVCPDKRRMVTGSHDMTVRLWDLETGVVLKMMKGHRRELSRLAVSRNGQFIVSGGLDGDVIVWHGQTGESLFQPIKAHSDWITSLEFSPDGTMLATCSNYGITKLWNTKTWQLQGKPIKHGHGVGCVRYSPSGDLLAIAASSIEIYTSDTRDRIAYFKGHKSQAPGSSLLCSAENLPI